MRLGFIQTEPDFGEVAANTEKVFEQIKGFDADLIVLPELFNTGYQFLNREEAFSLAERVSDGKTVHALLQISKLRKIHIVFGFVEESGGKVYNSALLVGPSGVVSVYRKSHLFDFEKEVFDPGDSGFAVFDIGLAKIGILICFDWRFPEPARILALKGADIICHPSNLVLPNAPDGMITRSFENNIFSVTADRVGCEARIEENPLNFEGKSQIVTPKGEVLYRASADMEESWATDIDPFEARNKEINNRNDLFGDRRKDLISDFFS